MQTGIDLAVSRLKEKWIPKEDEEFFFVDDDLEVDCRDFDADDYDYKAYVATGNCFKTREEAYKQANEYIAKFEEIRKK